MRVSPDGRSIVFDSERVGGLAQIWRIDTDGSNLKQLTAGNFADFFPFWSPDGQTVFFSSWRSGNERLWKVPANGGQPSQVTDLAFSAWKFPAGSNLIFGNHYDEQVSPPRFRPALLSPESGQIVRMFDEPSTTGFLDMLDERTLIYTETSGDVSNIWSRPVEGGTAKQLTKFTSEQIVRLSISHDGKRFAMARGTSTADIVLIKGFR